MHVFWCVCRRSMLSCSGRESSCSERVKSCKGCVKRRRTSQLRSAPLGLLSLTWTADSANWTRTFSNSRWLSPTRQENQSLCQWIDVILLNLSAQKQDGCFLEADRWLECCSFVWSRTFRSRCWRGRLYTCRGRWTQRRRKLWRRGLLIWLKLSRRRRGRPPPSTHS